MKIGELTLLGFFLLMMLAPLVSVTIISLRLRRRGWWLWAPWTLVVLGTLAVLQTLYSLELLTGAGGPAVGLLLAGMIASWFGLTIWLIVLTAVGPKLPPPGVAWRR